MGTVVGFDGGLVVEGEITFQNVRKLIDDGLSLVDDTAVDNCVVECSGVGLVDNSFLVLCLSWFRYAALSNKKIEFVGLDQALQRLFCLTGLDQLINMKVRNGS